MHVRKLLLGSLVFGILSLNLSLTGLAGHQLSIVMSNLIRGTDSIEIASWSSAMVGCLFSLWSLLRALKIWGKVIPSNLLNASSLKQIAMRRIRQQSFLLLVQGVILMTTTVTLFLDSGEQQATVRSYAFAMVSLLMFFRAGIEHWEQRSVDTNWDGRERRILPIRRTTAIDSSELDAIANAKDRKEG